MGVFIELENTCMRNYTTEYSLSFKASADDFIKNSAIPMLDNFDEVKRYKFYRSYAFYSLIVISFLLLLVGQWGKDKDKVPAIQHTSFTLPKKSFMELDLRLDEPKRKPGERTQEAANEAPLSGREN